MITMSKQKAIDAIAAEDEKENKRMAALIKKHPRARWRKDGTRRVCIDCWPAKHGSWHCVAMARVRCPRCHRLWKVYARAVKRTDAQHREAAQRGLTEAIRKIKRAATSMALHQRRMTYYTRKLEGTIKKYERKSTTILIRDFGND